MCAEYRPSSFVDKRISVRHLPVPNRWRWITTGTLSAHAAYPSTAETVPPTRRCRRSRSETVRACEVAVTVNVFALDTDPAGVVTEILPVDAPAGTVAVIFVEELTVNPAEVPANFTAVAPMKFVPLTVTTVPTGPLVGEKDEIVGLAPLVTVKFPALQAVPSGVSTEILPVDAPAGTVAVIFVEEFTVNVVDVPANLTSVAPVRLVPLIVTIVPTGPLVGEKDEMVGLAAHDDGVAAIVTPRTMRTTTVLGRRMLRDRDIDAS
jgi:hypothetical protein